MYIVTVILTAVLCSSDVTPLGALHSASKRKREKERRSEPLDDRMSEGVTSFESVAQCATVHTALPLQAESTKLPLSGRGQAVTARGQLKEKQATLETPPSSVRRHWRRHPEHISFAHLKLQRMFLKSVDTLFMGIKRIDQATDQPVPWDTPVTIGWPRKTGERCSPHLVEGRRHRNMPQKTTSDADWSVSLEGFEKEREVDALISTRILVSLICAPHVLPTFEGQLKWFDRTNCHGFL